MLLYARINANGQAIRHMCFCSNLLMAGKLDANFFFFILWRLGHEAWLIYMHFCLTCNPTQRKLEVGIKLLFLNLLKLVGRKNLGTYFLTEFFFSSNGLGIGFFSKGMQKIFL